MPEGVSRPQARDFTPRRFDPTRLELTIDFGLHAHGPATAWAEAAKPGSLIGVGGPRGSEVLSDRFAWNLLVGDETALPAIARRLEELPEGPRAIAVIEVENASDEQPLDIRADAEVHWLHRSRSERVSILDCVSRLTLPAGEGFAFSISLETSPMPVDPDKAAAPAGSCASYHVGH